MAMSAPGPFSRYGVRIANDPAFVAELAALGPGFEVYLQFDSLRKEALENIRGADLTGVRRRALEIPVSLCADSDFRAVAGRL